MIDKAKQGTRQIADATNKALKAFGIKPISFNVPASGRSSPPGGGA